MKLLSVSGYNNNHLPPLGLRFTQGFAEFDTSYFLIDDGEHFQKTFRLINAAVFGDDRQQLFAETSAEFSDDAGHHWEIRRRKDRVLVLKNDTVTKFRAEVLIKGLIERETPTENLQQTQLGQYQLSRTDKQFNASPLGKQSPEELKLLKLISEQCDSIVEACKHSLQDPAAKNQESLEKICSALEPIHRKYSEITEQYKALFESKETQPRETQSEIDDLQQKITLMRGIAQATQDVLGANPSLETLKLNAKEINRKIDDNLEHCQLERLPERALPPDWNVALQCLCYLNALDKLIPLLSQSVVRYNKHLKESIDYLKSDEAEFFKEKNSLFSELKKSRDFLNSKNASFNNGKTAESMNSESFWDNFNISKAKDKAKQEVYVQFSEIQKHLDNVILALHNVQPKNNLPVTSPKHLDDFLKQTFLKRDTLKKHWENICQEFKIDAATSLHDFLQFILRYNELFILRQKASELNNEIKSRGVKINHIRKLLLKWYETIGSQKQIQLDNPQIVLSEAQNVTRYLREKEQKLRQVNKNRLEIEVKFQSKNNLRAKLDQYHDQWQEVLKKSGFSQQISLSDPRIVTLLEKHQLLRSMRTLQTHISSLNIFPASGSNWPYEAFCLWRISGKSLISESVDPLIDCLKKISGSCHHLFFVSQDGLTPEFKRAGIGQISVFSPPARKTSEGPPRQGELRPTPTLANPGKRPEPRPAQSQRQELLSPQVQAVLDLLNGAPGR